MNIFQFKRSGSVKIPSTLSYGEPAVSFDLNNKPQFWIGNESKQALLVNDSSILITSIQVESTLQPTVDGYYIFAITPTNGLPNGINLNDIALLFQSNWYLVMSFSNSPASIKVGTIAQNTYIKQNNTWVIVDGKKFIKIETDTYVNDLNQIILIDATNNDVNVTLPFITAYNDGQEIEIKRIDNTTNVVTLYSFFDQSIDTATSIIGFKLTGFAGLILRANFQNKSYFVVAESNNAVYANISALETTVNTIKDNQIPSINTQIQGLNSFLGGLQTSVSVAQSVANAANQLAGSVQSTVNSINGPNGTIAAAQSVATTASTNAATALSSINNATTGLAALNSTKADKVPKTALVNNLQIGGQINTSVASSVDNFEKFNINQNTAGQTLTLATPSTNKIVYVENTGNTAFTIYGTQLQPKTHLALIYDGTQWAPSAGGGGFSSTLSGLSTSTAGAINSGDTLIGAIGKIGASLNTQPGQVVLGNASSVATPTTLSGDVTVNSSGVTAIGSGKVTGAQIANATITTTQISATAGIMGSQLANNTITAGQIANGIITTTQIAQNTIANSNLTQSSANTWKGNNSSTTANITDNQTASLTEDTSSVLTITGGANALLNPTKIEVKKATTSQSGYLSNTDWNTFNNKQNALTNPITGSGSGGQVALFSDTNAITSSAINTAFNKSFEANASNIQMNGTASAGGSSSVARGDHIHPSDATKADKIPNALAISNLATGGSIGLATATVDIYEKFNITQTTLAQTITLPNPTATSTNKKIVYVENGGTVAFTIYGVQLAPSTHIALIFNGTVWVPASGGSGTLPFQTVTSATATLTTFNQTVYVDATSNNVVITLPTAVGNSGQSLEFKRIDNTINTVRIIPNGTQTLDGETSAEGIYLFNQNDAIVVRSNGTNSYIISDNRNAANKVDYLLAARNANLNFVPNTFYVPNTVLAGNIPVNTTTGAITLQAGKTYELTAQMRLFGSVEGSFQYILYRWVDFDTQQALSSTTTGENESSIKASNNATAPIATCIYTPEVNQTVGLLLTGEAPNNIIENSPNNTSFISIKQIGSSLATQANGINTVDYGIVRLSMPVVPAVTNAVIIWNADTKKGNIPFNSTTNSFSLTAGKTYEITVSVRQENISGAFDYRVQDTNGNAIGYSGTANSTITIGGTNTTTYYTATSDVNIQVTIPIIAVTGPTIGPSSYGGGYGYFSVKQIGSTAVPSNADGTVGGVKYALMNNAEVATGDSWLAGQPIYRKIIPFTNRTPGTSTVIDATLTNTYCENIINCYGMFKEAGATLIINASSPAINTMVNVYAATSGLTLEIGDARSSTNSGYVIIEYTKS
jgi:hypothetical protein